MQQCCADIDRIHVALWLRRPAHPRRLVLAGNHPRDAFQPRNVREQIMRNGGVQRKALLISLQQRVTCLDRFEDVRRQGDASEL